MCLLVYGSQFRQNQGNQVASSHCTLDFGMVQDKGQAPELAYL